MRVTTDIPAPPAAETITTPPELEEPEMTQNTAYLRLAVSEAIRQRLIPESRMVDILRFLDSL